MKNYVESVQVFPDLKADALDKSQQPEAADYFNYTLGRGSVWIDGRPIGNVPSLRLIPQYGKMGLAFESDSMTKENLALYFESLKGKEVHLEYRANNAKGVNVSYDFPRVVLRAGETELLGKEWQALKFTGRVKDGFSYSYPQIDIITTIVGTMPKAKTPQQKFHAERTVGKYKSSPYPGPYDEDGALPDDIYDI